MKSVMLDYDRAKANCGSWPVKATHPNYRGDIYQFPSVEDLIAKGWSQGTEYSHDYFYCSAYTKVHRKNETPNYVVMMYQRLVPLNVQIVPCGHTADVFGIVKQLRGKWHQGALAGLKSCADLGSEGWRPTNLNNYKAGYEYTLGFEPCGKRLYAKGMARKFNETIERQQEPEPTNPAPARKPKQDFTLKINLDISRSDIIRLVKGDIDNLTLLTTVWIDKP